MKKPNWELQTNKEIFMDRQKRCLIISIAVLAAILCLFVGTERDAYASRSGSDLDDITYTAGDMLEHNLLYVLDRTLPILSTSFVNLDNLKETSAFGRLVGVQVASRFSQHGYKVTELRLSNGKVLVQEKNGELALFREMNRIDKCHDAQAIIVGTYSIAGNRAFLSTRLVSTLDNSILSSYNFSIRMGDLLKTLAEKNLSSAAESKKPEEISDKGPLPSTKKDPVLSGSIFLELTNPLAAKIVQSQLSRLGYYTSNVDGIWKKRSREALASFKKDQRLSGEDVWNMETQIALFSVPR